MLRCRGLHFVRLCPRCKTNPRPAVPGQCPFVGFFHAAEGVEQARLDQVFRGVASKVKDTVFSTLG